MPRVGDSTTVLSGATSATSAATFDARGALGFVAALTFNASAAGSVAFSGSIDDTSYGPLGTVTAVASTTVLAHFVDVPIKTLKVDPAALSAGTVTVKIARLV